MGLLAITLSSKAAPSSFAIISESFGFSGELSASLFSTKSSFGSFFSSSMSMISESFGFSPEVRTSLFSKISFGSFLSSYAEFPSSN